MMKIAVIGGAGFIGTALCRILKQQGHEMQILDTQKSSIFPEDSILCNVTDETALTDNLKDIDVIYNLAAEHRDDVRPVSKYYDVNVGGAQNIVKAAKANGIKTIIFTSTVAVYGLDAGDPQHGSNEKDTPAPFNDYGHSKLEAEKIFKAWADEAANHTLVTTRLVATFGIGNRGNIYNLMRQIADGKFMMVGSGQNRKSIAYLGNVAAFLAHGLTFKPGRHVYNYADKPDLLTKDLVLNIRKSLGLSGLGIQLPYVAGLLGGITFDVAAKISGKTFPISCVRIQKFCANTIVSAEKLQETDFQAPYTLTEGLNEMIAHEFQHKLPDSQNAA